MSPLNETRYTQNCPNCGREVNSNGTGGGDCGKCGLTWGKTTKFKKLKVKNKKDE
jgi:tRNA(Ile2) C34 agmatinyltransferase TiaS